MGYIAVGSLSIIVSLILGLVLGDFGLMTWTFDGGKGSVWAFPALGLAIGCIMVLVGAVKEVIKRSR